MPITQERQTIQDLRAAGFSEQQAVLLSAKFEETAQATSQDLKTFISAENERLRGDVARQIGNLEVRLANFEARVERSMRIQLATVLSAFVGVTGLAVALIKLLP